MVTVESRCDESIQFAVFPSIFPLSVHPSFQSHYLFHTHTHTYTSDYSSATPPTTQTFIDAVQLQWATGQGQSLSHPISSTYNTVSMATFVPATAISKFL